MEMVFYGMQTCLQTEKSSFMPSVLTRMPCRKDVFYVFFLNLCVFVFC